MRDSIDDGPDHQDAKMKITYTRFPKDWTAEQIYKYLVVRAE